MGYFAARLVWTDLWYRRADQFSRQAQDFGGYLRDVTLYEPWNEVFDLLEFAVTKTMLQIPESEVNAILQREMSGYRFRRKLLMPVSDQAELEALDEALAVSEPFQGARAHIRNALEKLAQRPQPDVRSAITEAVSAVESAARIVSRKKKATLATDKVPV